MLVGVVPFGLVAGATPVGEGSGAGRPSGFSTIVFAGASQLAATEALADGGSAWWRWSPPARSTCGMLLYSASLAPYLATEPLRAPAGGRPTS